MKQLIFWMERVGGVFLLVIVCLVTATSVTRYLFNWPIPDSDSIGRLLLSIVVFWGIAAACLRGEHIQIDLVIEALPTVLRRWAIRLSVAITLVALVFMTITSFGRIQDIRSTGETTFDFGILLWPFYGIAFLGAVAAVMAQLYVVFFGVARVTDPAEGAEADLGRGGRD